MPATTATMKALRFHGKQDIRLDDIPTPVCGKGQVKVKPKFVGICGTDLHEYMGGPSIIPTSPHPLTGEQVPLTLGHEFSAIVEEVGDDITDMKPGDRVVVQPIIYDGTCGACQEGLINCCYSNGFVGLSGWGGGLSEHVVLPRASVLHLPDNVRLEIGALVEPIAVAWHAVNISPFKPGDSVLVLGGGPIGLAVLQALRARGAGTVIVSEVAPRRKEFAKEFGATHVLDPTQDDIVARCKELCDGVGPHVAFDAAGVQAGLTAGLHAIRARGTLVNIAVWEKPASLFVNDLVFREKHYMGVATYQAGDFQAVIDALAEGEFGPFQARSADDGRCANKGDYRSDLGKLVPDAMITRTIRLDEVESKGFKTLIEEKDKHVKILVEVDV
ncbi:MAG: hypothetical protein M4579_004591 [Chaenotheca gracillima]|nr:MAG: hypothetical protein M4579_004591 [Chaenotheca gracillima]